MLIALDERTLNQNIMKDGLIAGSGAGDIILIQDVSREAYDDDEYKALPDNTALHSDSSLQSIKSKTPSIIHRVMVSDKILVNGEEISCDKSFLTFIREATSGKKKVTFVCQETRELESQNVNNKAVLNAISEHLNHHSYTVEALDYIEGTNSLNFIVFDRGYKADFSQIFAKNEKSLRGIKNYNKEEIKNWSKTEFALLCIHIIRQYNLAWLAILLTSDRYCQKRFSIGKILSPVHNPGFFNELIDINGFKYYIRNDWTIPSQEDFFNWLLDRVSEVSNDVFNISFPDSVKSLKIPDIVTGIDYSKEQIEIFYSGPTYKSIQKDINKQNIFQRDNVILVDEKITRLLSYSFFYVKYMKEQSLILSKTKTKILPAKENDVLDLIKKGDL